MTSCIQPVTLRAVFSSETMPRIGSLSGSISTVTRGCLAEVLAFYPALINRASQLVLCHDQSGTPRSDRPSAPTCPRQTWRSDSFLAR